MGTESQAETMRSLGQTLGLSTMTVSRALRNAPGVSPMTRKRVLNAARLAHYRPDPLLAVLNTYRHRRRSISDAKIAFLTNFATPEEWRSVATFARYFEGIRRRSQLLGYQVEPFWLGDPELTGRRASQILRGRGINGVIVGPLAHGMSALQLDWELFSTVAVGRSLNSPRLATVSCNHFQSVELAWQEAWRRGYRRIGIILTKAEDSRTVGALKASYLLQQLQSGGEALPVLLTEGFSPRQVGDWTLRQRPDLVLGSEPQHYELLVGTAPCRGSRPKFLNLNVNPETDGAGIDQGHDKVGEHAAALLHLKMLQRETGIPVPRDLLLIDGVWSEGRGSWKLKAAGPGKRPARKDHAGGSIPPSLHNLVND
jgi:DNA-binding LacI/PurR family transcriptional regulator